MTGKIGYFLFALLVLTTGTLCRQQLPVQYASGGDSVGSLTQHGSASGKERPALFPPFVHRVRNRKRGHRTDAAYKLQTTRISDSFSPAFGKKSAPLQQSSGESPSRRGGLLRLFAGQNPDLTASIAPMRIFRPKRRTTLV